MVIKNHDLHLLRPLLMMTVTHCLVIPLSVNIQDVHSTIGNVIKQVTIPQLGHMLHLEHGLQIMMLHVLQSGLTTLLTLLGIKMVLIPPIFQLQHVHMAAQSHYHNNQPEQVTHSMDGKFTILGTKPICWFEKQKTPVHPVFF